MTMRYGDMFNEDIQAAGRTLTFCKSWRAHAAGDCITLTTPDDLEAGELLVRAGVASWEGYEATAAAEGAPTPTAPEVEAATEPAIATKAAAEPTPAKAATEPPPPAKKKKNAAARRGKG